MTDLNNIQINCNIISTVDKKTTRKKHFVDNIFIFIGITFEIEFHDCVVLCDLTNFDRIKKKYI